MSINFCVACRQHQYSSKNFQMLSPRKMYILFSKIVCQFMCIKRNRFVRNITTWTLIGHISIALDATKPLLLSFGRSKLSRSSIVATVVGADIFICPPDGNCSDEDSTDKADPQLHYLSRRQFLSFLIMN